MRIIGGLLWEERSEEKHRRFAWPYWLPTVIRTSFETCQPAILSAEAGWMWDNSSSICEVWEQSWRPHQKEVLNYSCRLSLKPRGHPRPIVISTENSEKSIRGVSVPTVMTSILFPKRVFARVQALATTWDAYTTQSGFGASPRHPWTQLHSGSELLSI